MCINITHTMGNVNIEKAGKEHRKNCVYGVFSLLKFL